MLFSSVAFIAFFLVVFTTYWGSGLLPLSNLALKRGRVYLLLASSYFFYGCWSVPLLSLIAFSTLVDFVVGRILDQLDIAHSLMRRWGEVEGQAADVS